MAQTRKVLRAIRRHQNREQSVRRYGPSLFARFAPELLQRAAQLAAYNQRAPRRRKGAAEEVET